MIAKVNENYLVKYFRGFEDSLIPRGRVEEIEFSIQVSHEEEILYEFDGSDNTLSLEQPINLNDDLIEVVDRSGLYSLEVEFNPNSKFSHDIKNGKISVDGQGIVALKRETADPGFREWFIQVCFLLGHKVYLIPDTNFVRRSYYSNFLKEILSHNINISLRLPRLGIVEVENIYNQNKASHNKPIKPDEAEKFLQNEKRKGKERRIAFRSLGEILSMKNQGADLLPPVDMSLLQSFTPMAGKGYADTWIRKEISNSEIKLVSSTFVKKDQVENSDIAFLTCDLMNGLCAIAEDLNVIYFFRSGDNKINLGQVCYEKLASLIINTAIQFEECMMVIKAPSKQHKLKLRGAWSGKSLYDWQNNHVLYEELR